MNWKYLREQHRRQDKAASQHDPIDDFVPDEIEARSLESSARRPKQTRLAQQIPRSIKCSECGTMKLPDAVGSFTDWSAPWTFREIVRAKLIPDSEDAELFEALLLEASRFEHWNAGDLAFGCKIAHAATKKKFPKVDDRVIGPIVRAASYDWK